MSDLSNSDMYDEDEYFVKFIRIHPSMIYHLDNDVMKSKYNLQIKLLDMFKSNKIDRDELISKYTNVIDVSKINKSQLSSATSYYNSFVRKILLDLKAEHNKELLETIKQIESTMY